MSKSTIKTSKWLEYELAIQKFNTAVPYFVELLRSNHNNIMKLKRLNQIEDTQKQWTAASKTVTQLTSLLSEMNILRSQVSEIDIKKFDRLISNSRQSALNAIKSHLQDLPDQTITVKTTNKQEIDQQLQIVADISDDLKDQQLQLVAELSDDLKERELRAAELEKLQEDVEFIYSMYRDLSEMVHVQAESVDKTESSVETTHHNVLEGEKMLCQAVKYKRGMYPLIGALLGCAVGGPLGLYAGFKIGGMSAMVCSFLGFTGGKVLKNHNQDTIDAAEEHRKAIAT